MKGLFLAWALLLISLSTAQTPFESRLALEDLREAPVKIIPFPSEVHWGGSPIVFDSLRLIRDQALEPAIEKELTGWANDMGISLDGASRPSLEFVQSDSLPKEGYELEVSKKGIRIGAATQAGRYYALQTLRQLSRKGEGIQPVEIQDAPEHEIRGFMLDVGRNYLSMEYLKKQLDIMARYKLNVFQWHLTDYPAWRIESKRYPQLTAAQNHRPTRDPGKFYTYEEIRELIQYAQERQIMVIPEIDMPGHSSAFHTATGHKMESPRGMEILKDVLQEFFEEIPKEMAPILHIGSDEVQIPNAKEFMEEMIAEVRKYDREVMVWNPGLPADSQVIRQTWRAEGFGGSGYREVDSWNSYINNGEPMIHIPKLFFKPIGAGSEHEVLGGIIALWHDVNLEGEESLTAFHPLYPSLLTYAWTNWTADVQQASREYLTMVPKKGTPEHAYFAAFEEFLMDHQQRYFQELPFPYAAQAHTHWKLIGPFKDRDELPDIRDEYRHKDTLLTWQQATGNTIYIRDRFKLGGQYPEAQPGETYFALTYIHSDRDRQVPFWVGFETAYRANRIYSGIPQLGQWDVNGGALWINGKPLEAPRWENPGWAPSTNTGWGTPEDKEIPWTFEEFYWTRPAVHIPLNKGWNQVIIRVPGRFDYQNWMFTFAPLDQTGIRFSTSPEDTDL